MVATGGRSGTGKSALARALAPQLGPLPGAVVLRSDAERKALFGGTRASRCRPPPMRREVTARVYAAIADKARRAAAAGHAAILDAVFARPGERELAKTSAAVLGVPFHGLFLEAPLATRLARVGGRSRDASDADAAVVRAQESYDLGALDWAPDRRVRHRPTTRCGGRRRCWALRSSPGQATCPSSSGSAPRDRRRAKSWSWSSRTWCRRSSSRPGRRS